MARRRAFDEAEVLDRAMTVFWRRGYEGASMAELTTAMDLSSPSIYAAFGSKRGLFDAVLGRYRERRADYRDWLLAGTTARQVAERMLFGAIEWLTDPAEPPGCLLIQAGLSAGPANADVPPELAEQRSSLRPALIARFIRAKAERDLPPSSDPAELADYLRMVFLGVSIQATEGVPAAHLRELADRALDGWPS